MTYTASVPVLLLAIVLIGTSFIPAATSATALVPDAPAVQMM